MWPLIATSRVLLQLTCGAWSQKCGSLWKRNSPPTYLGALAASRVAGNDDGRVVEHRINDGLRFCGGIVSAEASRCSSGIVTIRMINLVATLIGGEGM
eukprot:109441-Chlamydomonas_euryale.AAC.1